MKTTTRIAAALAALALASAARAGTTAVDAKTSIFSSSTSASGSADNSSLASMIIAIPAGTTYITFSAAGLINPAHSDHGADGGFYDGNGVDVTSLGSISGIIDSNDRTLALMGAFVTSSPSAGAAPARLNFTGNHDFLTLSPLVNQGFFIGDGLTAASDVQQFYVPAGATYLQLGYADAYITSSQAFVGTPSAYQDNNGSLDVTYNFAAVVPEPTSAAMLGTMAIPVLLRRRR